MKTHVSLLICLHDDVHTHPAFQDQRESVGKNCKNRTEAILVTMLTRKLLRVFCISSESLLQCEDLEHCTVYLNSVCMTGGGGGYVYICIYMCVYSPCMPT